MNALLWLLIPVAVTCFAAWWIAQRSNAAERDDPDALSPAELQRMQQALAAEQPGPAAAESDSTPPAATPTEPTSATPSSEPPTTDSSGAEK